MNYSTYVNNNDYGMDGISRILAALSTEETNIAELIETAIERRNEKIKNANEYYQTTKSPEQTKIDLLNVEISEAWKEYTKLDDKADEFNEVLETVRELNQVCQEKYMQLRQEAQGVMDTWSSKRAELAKYKEENKKV